MRLKLPLATACIANLLCVGMLSAQTGDATPPAWKAGPPGYLSAADVPDVVRLVGPPPPSGSGTKDGDVATFRSTRALRGSPRWSLATSDAEYGPAPMLRDFSCALTTGLGVFCDGYDLSSVALVLPSVLASFGQKSLTGVESALLASSALIGATIGALVFGVLGQKGRMRFYGYDVLILAFAALSQAFVPNLYWLMGIRFVLGLLRA